MGGFEIAVRPLYSRLLHEGYGKRDALYEAIRAAMLAGALPEGTRLPSSRMLAAMFAVSRGIAAAVYDMLHAEGYVRTVVGSGTYAAYRMPGGRQAAAADLAATDGKYGAADEGGKNGAEAGGRTAAGPGWLRLSDLGGRIAAAGDASPAAAKSGCRSICGSDSRLSRLFRMRIGNAPYMRKSAVFPGSCRKMRSVRKDMKRCGRRLPGI